MKDSSRGLLAVGCRQADGKRMPYAPHSVLLKLTVREALRCSLQCALHGEEGLQCSSWPGSGKRLSRGPEDLDFSCYYERLERYGLMAVFTRAGQAAEPSRAEPAAGLVEERERKREREKEGERGRERDRNVKTKCFCFLQ